METISPRRSLRLMQKDGVQLPPNSVVKGLPAKNMRTPKFNLDTENKTNAHGTPPKRSKKKNTTPPASPTSSLANSSSPKPSSPLSSPQRSPLSSPQSSRVSSPLARSPSKGGVSTPTGVSSPPNKRRMRSPSSPHVAYTPSPTGTRRVKQQPSALFDGSVSSPHTPTKKAPRPILKSPKLDVSPTLKKVWASGSQPHLEKLVEIHTAMNTRSPHHMDSPAVTTTPRRLKFKAVEELVESHYYSPSAKPSRRLSNSPESLSAFRDMRTGKPLDLKSYNHTHQAQSDEEGYDSDDFEQFMAAKPTNNNFFDQDENESPKEEKEELPTSGSKRKRERVDSEGDMSRRLSGGLSGDEEPHMEEYLRNAPEDSYNEDGEYKEYCTVC